MNKQSKLLICASLATVLLLDIVPALAEVDLARSKVVATSRQMNVPVDGSFKRFNAQLIFEPGSNLEGRAAVTIDTSSYDLGDESYNKQVLGKEWFDSATYPKATFISSSIKPTGGDHYNVTGTLTIKNVSQIVKVPVTVSKQGNTLIFDGSLPIKRTTFTIGTGEWKDTSVVSDDVFINFHLVDVKH